MRKNTLNRKPWIGSVLSVALVCGIIGFNCPARAQTDGDVVAKLRSLPPEALTTPLRRYLYMYEQRAYPFGSIPPGAMDRARQEHVSQFGPLRPSTQGANGVAGITSPVTWTAIGPAPISGPVTGRTNSIAVDPNNTNTIYIGAATGGVWKTTNGGTSWTALTDTQCSTAMGSIAIDPTNSQIVWAGTGEENFSGDSYYGCGVLKSTDGGNTWTQLGASIFVNAGGGGASIGKLALRPGAPTTVLVASDKGLIRSSDGGANWSNVLPGTATDVVFDPGGNIAFASLGNIFGNANNGVYMSSDGGASWSKLGGGLPTTNVGRINLALAASSSSTVYASVQNTSTFGLLGIWKTTNGGTTWSQLSATGASCASQCWYDMAISVDPTNAATVYFSGFSVYKSTDGGSNFTDIGGSIHVDQHAFAFLPGNSSTIFAGNDGGVYKSTNGGSSWTSLNTNLAITQFYTGFSIHPSNANIKLGGTQDNHTVQYTGSTTWTPVTFSGVGGCDGGFTVIDQGTPTTQYAECQWTSGSSFSGPRRSDNNGTFNLVTTGININDSGQFIAPIIPSPSNTNVLYFGTNKVYKTANKGANWTASGTTLGGNVVYVAEAPSNANTVYASATNGVIYKSTNGNASYTALSGTPNRVPTYIVVHPTDPNTALATFSGFGTGHVWKTTDGGATWSNISGNLPNIPVNTIAIDPNNPTTKFLIGTDLGVYASQDGGTTWVAANAGLPNVPVLDLKIASTGLVNAATHGRGAFTGVILTVTAALIHDFNGDGKSDILWRNANGDATIWFMNGVQVTLGGGLGNIPTIWAVVGTGDFNGDGKTDILWRNSGGDLAIWFMNGNAVLSGAGLGNVPLSWTIAGVADFNGDGKADILFRNNNGDASIWFMNGSQVVSGSGLGNIPTVWTSVATGDFNGDGKADILWRNDNGDLAIWFMNGSQVVSGAGLGNVTTDWGVSGVRDFNGDGKSDILWRNINGDIAMWFLNGSQVLSGGGLGNVPTSWSIVETADFNADGKGDLLFRNTNGDAAIWLMNGAMIATTGGLGNIPTSWAVQSINAN